MADRIITSVSGQKYKLRDVAGYGSQGVVYKETTGKYMVKFYYPSGSAALDKDVMDRLLYIKNVRTPKNFVSVIDVIDSPYIGYVMEKVEGYKPLNSYLIPPQNGSFSEWYNVGLGFRERLFVGYIIAKAFGELEAENLSYCDISGNNILVKIEKNTAAVKMIDIDNIYTAGRGKASVLGTPRYIAPEVIAGQKNPDVLSDNYSLAVILFELLRVGHPYISDNVLDGTPDDEKAALAGKFGYVTEENSASMLPADIVFTEKLKELFRKCFEDGKQNRLLRPTAKEFEYALLEASNKLIRCPSCGAWHYARKTGRDMMSCPWCDGPSNVRARVNFYDCLYHGPDYRNACLIGGAKRGKLVNSYILRDGRNFIKGLYILRYDDAANGKSLADNYMAIVKDSAGYHVYNQFSKDGIYLKRYGSEKYEKIENKKENLLHNGDELFLEIGGTQGTGIECGGSQYSFIRTARFMEVKK